MAARPQIHVLGVFDRDHRDRFVTVRTVVDERSLCGTLFLGRIIVGHASVDLKQAGSELPPPAVWQNPVASSDIS